MEVPSGNQGSLKNHFLLIVLQRTYKGVSKNLKKTFFKAPFLVPLRPFKPGFCKELFPLRVL